MWAGMQPNIFIRMDTEQVSPSTQNKERGKKKLHEPEEVNIDCAQIVN